MPKIIDLTNTLTASTTAVPGHPQVELTPIHTHEVHGRSNSSMRFSIHTGTHVDPPYHFDPKGKTIEQVPLERLVGTAVLIDLRRVARPRTPITVADIKSSPGFSERALRGNIVVLHTGWNRRMFKRPNYYRDNPYLAVETARWLASKKIKALALDTPQDHLEGDGTPRPGDFPVHRTFLTRGIPFIEHLANLHKIPRRTFQMIALPIKIQGGDGAPARVIILV